MTDILGYLSENGLYCQKYFAQLDSLHMIVCKLFVKKVKVIFAIQGFCSSRATILFKKLPYFRMVEMLIFLILFILCYMFQKVKKLPKNPDVL